MTRYGCPKCGGAEAILFVKIKQDITVLGNFGIDGDFNEYADEEESDGREWIGEPSYECALCGHEFTEPEKWEDDDE